jgi:hypothetical protein
MPKRACDRHPSGPLSPETFGSRFSSGTCTSCRISSLVTDARSEYLRLVSGALKPFMPFSTRKPVISSLPLFSSRSFAHTTARSAIVPFVIHILAPFRTYSPPFFTARVIMPEGLEPKSGSVRPKQPITSPFAIFGSHFMRCSSDP